MGRENLHVHYSAEDYDRYSRNGLEEYDNGLMRRTNQEHKMMFCSEPALLDVGTGTGQLLIKMCRDRRFDKFRFVGTDFFEDMLDIAREAVDQAGLKERIELHQNDVHDLPYEDEFTNFVISRSTIHHWANPVRAFQEIYRVLKPGGVAIIHEPRRDPHPEALAEFNRRRGELGIEAARMDEKYTPAEVDAFLADAGLAAYGVINAPKSGPRSMGFEVRIAKRSRLRVSMFRGASRLRTAMKWF